VNDSAIEEAEINVHEQKHRSVLFVTTSNNGEDGDFCFQFCPLGTLDKKHKEQAIGKRASAKAHGQGKGDSVAP
jgi:2-methylcitrate dehydratase PrpD